MPGSPRVGRHPPPEGSAPVYLAVVVQSLSAGGTHIIAKIAVGTVDPFTLTLARSVVASVAMLAIMLLRGKWVRPHREDLGLVLALSFVAIPVNQFFFLLGMHYTIPSNAALLYAATPVAVLLISRLVLHEKLKRRKVIGVCVALVGVVVVIFERGVSGSEEHFMGNVIIVFAVIAWALYTVFGKKLIAKYGAMEASSMTVLIGTILFLPVGIFPAARFPFAELGRSTWLEILYLGVVTSVFAYFLWYYALSRLEAGKVAIFTNLQPILTTLLAVVFLGQDITVAFLVGGVITIGGVVVAQYG